jgi:hydrogenase maturation protease
MLIIGCGNRQRGDDAAGILVLERLRELGVEADTRIGDGVDLIEAWDSVDEVIVVDAVLTGAPVGTVQAWDGRQLPASVSTTISTHGFGIAEAIELAGVLNRLPTRLRVYGIEGQRFVPEAEISSEVKRAVEEVVQRIIADVGAPPRTVWPSPENLVVSGSLPPKQPR